MDKMDDMEVFSKASLAHLFVQRDPLRLSCMEYGVPWIVEFQRPNGRLSSGQTMANVWWKKMGPEKKKEHGQKSCKHDWMVLKKGGSHSTEVCPVGTWPSWIPAAQTSALAAVSSGMDDCGSAICQRYCWMMFWPTQMVTLFEKKNDLMRGQLNHQDTI